MCDTSRPNDLITGRERTDYLQINKLNFRNYVHAYILKGKTNTNKERTIGAIILHPSGKNRRGGILCH